MKRALIYARVSSKRQAADGLPVDSQLEQCRVKAEALGATVMREFVDGGISGTTDKRPAFQEAMAYCEAMDIDYFITWHSSRFARNVADASRWKLYLQTTRTKLVYVSGEYNVETDDGWLMDGINSLLDENYSRRVSTDTRRSMLKAARDGFFMGARVPFGYASVPDGKRRRLAIHPGEAEVIKKIYGLSLQGVGVKLIALTLNDSGQLLRGSRWAKNTLNNILTSEVYCGVTIFNRRKNRVVNPPDLWIRVESHPAIIEPAQFSKVQDGLFSRRPERAGGTPKAQTVFAGLLRCGECDGALQLTSGTSRAGLTYHYYGCAAHQRGKHRCTFKNLQVSSFEPWLISELLDKVLTPEVLAKVFNDVTSQGKEWSRDRRLRRESLVRELRDTESRRNKLYGVLEVMGVDAPNLADIGPRLRQLNDQIRGLEQTIIKLEEEKPVESELDGFDPEEVAGILRGLIQDCSNVKAQRSFIGSFVEKATVSGDSVAVWYDQNRMVSVGATAVRGECKWLLNLGSNQGPTD